MSHIEPLERGALPEFEPLFDLVEASMGFVPNSFLTMARWPELLQSFSTYAGTVMNSGEVSTELKQLVAFVVSQSAGCGSRVRNARSHFILVRKPSGNLSLSMSAS